MHLIARYVLNKRYIENKDIYTICYEAKYNPKQLLAMKNYARVQK